MENNVPVAFISTQGSLCCRDRCSEPGTIWYGNGYTCVFHWLEWQSHRLRKGWLVLPGKEN